MLSRPQVGQWWEANTTSARSGEGVDRLGEITGPGVRVAHHRAAQGQQVVQVVGRVLGHAQRAETREIEVHFGGRLGAGRHLELDLHAVDRVCFTGSCDVDGGDDDGDLAGGRRLAEPAADLTHRPARQQGAVHVGCPPRHCRSGVDVFGDRVLGEAFRRQHRHRARIHVGLRGDAQDAAEVIDMAVGVDHRDDGPVAAAMLAVERQCRRGDLGGNQGVDDDDAVVGFHERHVGDVQPADLVDARHHFVEALFGGQRRLPPQAGMHRRRRGSVQEGVGIVVPDDSAVCRPNHARRQGRNESAVRGAEIGVVLERQDLSAVGGLDDGSGRLVIHLLHFAIDAAGPESISPTNNEYSNNFSGFWILGPVNPHTAQTALNAEDRNYRAKRRTGEASIDGRGGRGGDSRRGHFRMFGW